MRDDSKKEMKKEKGYALSALRRANEIALKANKKVYFLNILLSLVMTGNIFATLAATEYITNSAYNLFMRKSDYQSVLKGILFFAILLLVFMGIEILQRLAENKLMLDVTYRFERDLNAKLSKIKWDCYESHDTYLKIHEVRSKSLDTVKKLLRSIVFFITFVPSACIFGYYLFQINLFAVLGYIAAIFIFNRIAGKRFEKVSKLWEEIQPYTQKQNYFLNMSGDKTTHQEFKFNRLFGFTSNRWEALFNDEYKIKLKIFKKYEFVLQGARIIMNIPYIAMLIVISYEIARGTLQIGFLLMANALLNTIIDKTLSLQSKITDSRIESRFIKVYDEIMALPEAPKSNAKPVSCNIDMKSIVYTYPQSESKALNGLDFFIKYGEKIAVVGVNGSGKTTCMNLLLSLTDQYSGTITNDKKPIDLSHSVSCILQDFSQYQMTVKENIEAGNPQRQFSDHEILTILDKVGLKEIVLSLKDGIHTKLGQLEKGVELSKGQWQRLAIARLLAKEDATLWILDEPTAYLDPLSEIEIYNMIYELAGKRTVLFISHRLGFAKKADRIVLFDSGRIVEQGTHDDLVSFGGIYSEMYKGQESWYVS